MQKIIYLVCLLLVVVSCHLDEPTKPDTSAPAGEFLGVIAYSSGTADGDTLIWKRGSQMIDYTTSLPYVDGELTLIDTIENYKMVYNVSDKGELYKAELKTEYDDQEIVITSSEVEEGENYFNLSISNLGALGVSNGIYNLDYTIKVMDESENSTNLTNIPKVQTAIPSFMTYFQLGVPDLFSLTVEDDQLVKREILNNFGEHQDKLIFMQFHAIPCPACMLEGKHLQELYESNDYNPDEIYMATFFSSPVGYEGSSEAYIENFLVNNGIQGVFPRYDHFFDGEEGEYAQNVKKHFGIIQNDVLAIFPNGEVDIFELGTDFEAWIHEMMEKYEAMK